MRMDEAVLLRIFLGEDDRAHGHPTYRLVVEIGRARLAWLERRSAGAGRLRPPPATCAPTSTSTPAHAAPIVVEIVDEEDQDRGVPARDRSADRGPGLVTMEKVRAWRPARAEGA